MDVRRGLTLLVVVIALSWSGTASAEERRSNASDWAQLAGAPIWDPCTTITWSTVDDGGPLDVAMERGIGKLAAYTGLAFARVESGGMVTTAVKPDAEVMAVVAGIAYADNLYRWDYSIQRYWITGSTVVVSASLLTRQRWRRMVRVIVLHELGHVMGLDHARHPGQVMWDGWLRAGQGLGAGDRAGLAAVHGSACAVAA